VSPPSGAATAGHPRPSRALARTLVPGERVLLVAKPALGSIPLRALSALIAAAILIALGRFVIEPYLGARPARIAELLGLIVLLARLLWESLVWMSRSYAMTDRRIVAIVGVLRRLQIDLPLEHIQHVALYRSIRERATGLGTLLFATAGTARTEIAWVMVWSPEALLRTVRAQIESSHATPTTEQPKRSPMVIGLAGGIGSGKSTVAGALAKLGCVVIDSDALARDALRTTKVRDTLVSWWSDAILDDAGQVDRKAVAAIVFANPAQRKRLEALIHPLVRKSRADMIARAGNAPAVIVDAPLLFEAGVDRECDAVLFVDAPRPVRLERVMKTRNWSEADFDAREASQLPIADKRARSQLEISTDCPLAEIDQRASQALKKLLALRQTSPGPSQS